MLLVQRGVGVERRALTQEHLGESGSAEGVPVAGALGSWAADGVGRAGVELASPEEAKSNRCL